MSQLPAAYVAGRRDRAVGRCGRAGARVWADTDNGGDLVPRVGEIRPRELPVECGAAFGVGTCRFHTRVESHIVGSYSVVDAIAGHVAGDGLRQILCTRCRRPRGCSRTSASGASRFRWIVVLIASPAAGHGQLSASVGGRRGATREVPRFEPARMARGHACRFRPRPEPAHAASPDPLCITTRWRRWRPDTRDCRRDSAALGLGITRM